MREGRGMRVKMRMRERKRGKEMKIDKYID